MRCRMSAFCKGSDVPTVREMLHVLHARGLQLDLIAWKKPTWTPGSGNKSDSRPFHSFLVDGIEDEGLP
jgi:hypothetical protein